MKCRRKKLWLALAGLIVTTGCRAEPLPPAVLDAAPIEDAVPTGDIPEGCPSPPLLTAPVVDPHPNPTSDAVQAFRGRASAAALITATGGAGTAAPQRVAADGAFCIEVRLIEDAENVITFTPLDARGCPGKSTVRRITHVSRSGGRDGGVTAITNVAAHAEVRTWPEPTEGSPANLTDTDKNSSMVLEFSDWDVPDNGSCDQFAWITVDLKKIYTVSKIVLSWAADAEGAYGTCYAVLTSTSDAPSDPDPTDTTHWRTVADESGAPAGTQDLEINPEPARWVAVLLYENAETWWSEKFDVAEIEVMGQDPNMVPPPPADRCD